jgi:hypothetical protein
MERKIRIFKSPWHLAHDYDLMMALKDVAEFDLLMNYTRRWDERLRPFPENAQWVTHFEKGKYDLAILNIDQQCGNANLNKSVLARQMRDTIKQTDPDCKIVWINHGTPVYPEFYRDGTSKTKYVSEVLRKEIMDIIGNDPMVVNSHEAAENWGDGKVILHGMDPSEWPISEEKEPRVATFISMAGIGDKYYNRSFLSAVKEELKERYGISLQWVNTPGCFNARDIKDYKEFLSKTLIYFNPTYASPMPRSRTEAMFAGCCIITTPQHGGSDFIKDGYNGFVVPHNNVEYSAKLIDRLIKKGYNEAIQMGKNARKTAEELFGRERYKADWVEYLHELNIL